MMTAMLEKFLVLCGPSPDPGYLHVMFSQEILTKAKERIWKPVNRRILNQIVMSIIGRENTTRI